MSWEIRVSHEDLGGRTRLVLEADAEVPEDVVSSLISAYWLENVQYVVEEWDEDSSTADDAIGGQLQG